MNLLIAGQAKSFYCFEIGIVKKAYFMMLIVLFGLEMCSVATALAAKRLTQQQLSDNVGGDGNGSTIVVIMDKDLCRKMRQPLPRQLQ